MELQRSRVMVWGLLLGAGLAGCTDKPSPLTSSDSVDPEVLPQEGGPTETALASNEFTIELGERGEGKSSLYVVGSDEEWVQRSLPDRCTQAALGKAPAGNRWLVGRMRGPYVEGDVFEVASYACKGNRITARIRYFRGSAKPRDPRAAYFAAPLPQDLPAGRYYVLVTLAEYIREGGQVRFAPKTTIRASEYLTCLFDVPSDEAATAGPNDWQLPGSGLSPTEAAKGGIDAVAVCEVTAKTRFNFEGPWQYRTWPTVRVVEVLTGKLTPGESLKLQYSWIDKPSRRERMLAEGEKVIWLIRQRESSGQKYYVGVKALADAAENRKILQQGI